MYRTCCEVVEEIHMTRISVQKKYLLRMYQGVKIATLIFTLHAHYENNCCLVRHPISFVFLALRVLAVCKSYATVGCEDFSFFWKDSSPWSSFLTRDLTAQHGQVNVMKCFQQNDVHIVKNLTFGFDSVATRSLYCTAESQQEVHQWVQGTKFSAS